MLPLIKALSTRAIAAYGMQSAADEVEIVSVQPSTEVISVDSGATSRKRRKRTKNVSPIRGSHTSWYTWYPRTAALTLKIDGISYHRLLQE